MPKKNILLAFQQKLAVQDFLYFAYLLSMFECTYAYLVFKHTNVFLDGMYG